MARSKHSRTHQGSNAAARKELRPDYWLPRDFEYVQLLHDLAFFLEIDALAKRSPVPTYRAFSLFRAAYRLDSYDTTISRWLSGFDAHDVLDYIPTKRIREYLTFIQETGTLPELGAFEDVQYDRARRLRSVRGLGPAAIAGTLTSDGAETERLAIDTMLKSFSETAQRLYHGAAQRKWQAAHVVPPLMRLLHSIENAAEHPLHWELDGIKDPLTPVRSSFSTYVSLCSSDIDHFLDIALTSEVFFRRDSSEQSNGIRVRHQMGWDFFMLPSQERRQGAPNLLRLVCNLDPLSSKVSSIGLQGDLHLHTTWSDGSATPEAMARAASKLGLTYIVTTDHSRSAKLQGGLTPAMWLRQTAALASEESVIEVVQGLEVDILPDGTLDLPPSVLRATQLVIGSVHTAWTEDMAANTKRILAAIESGFIDILGHPSSAVLGKIGAPDFVRPPAPLDWQTIFQACAQWKVALEFNCFPSRFDLRLSMLKEALATGCMLSLGSDAHARAHLAHLRYGVYALNYLDPKRVLNTLALPRLTEWLADARTHRASLISHKQNRYGQESLPFSIQKEKFDELFACSIAPPQVLPKGSTIVGIDLTAGEKLTGVCLLRGCFVETRSFRSDEEILAFIQTNGPAIVSIDSPLGLPGGGKEVDPSAGIVREAERDLASIGIPAYPALIDSMRNLTLRGISLRKRLEALPDAPTVIESYPGAAQDIFRIPRKQRGLENLRSGLRRLGLTGPGLDTSSHDEVDAITSAVVGRYFEVGQFEPMGIAPEAQLIVPKIAPFSFQTQPVICLSGRTGAGKSVVARYLAVFYGFRWVRTRDIIRSLLLEDQQSTAKSRLSKKEFDVESISEKDLQEFGAVILNEHGQGPLRDALSAVIAGISGPVVVDSVRDLSDLGRLQAKLLRIWFVDCDDSQIVRRLTSRAKLGSKRLVSRPSIDSRSALLKQQAHEIIINNSSLEALRWRVDDTLFSVLKLVP